MKFRLAIVSNPILFFFALLSAGAYAQSNSSVDSENLDVLQLYGAVNPSAQPPDFYDTKALAESGDATAQNTFGEIWRYGYGAPKNLTNAVKWYRLAADQGNAAAQHALGSMYASGEGVEKNGTEAVRFFRLAADQGNAAAQHALGSMYASGEGVEKNDTEALRFFRLAADQGHEAARSDLEQLVVEKEAAELRSKFEEIASLPGAISMDEVEGASGGGYYIGDTIDGKPHGTGTWYLAWGDAETFGIHTGEFKNGLPNGQGRLVYNNGAVYEGEWKDDMRHGQGKLAYVEGDVYQGEFKENMRHGQGKLTAPDGSVIFAGPWLNGEPDSLIFTAKQKNWPLHYSLTAAAMGLDEAALDVESSEVWFKIPGYNAAIASKMHQAFLSCRNGIYPSYGQSVEFIESSIAGAQRRSERDALQADLVRARFFAEALTNGDCLGRFALIMEGFGLDIVDATLDQFEYFYADIIDLDRFHNEVALLLGMPTHQHVFKYGPWAAEVDRAALANSLESFRSSNDININRTVDAWQNLQAGLQNGLMINTIVGYMGELKESNALIQSLNFLEDRVSFEIGKSCSSASCLNLSKMYNNL